MNIHIYKKKVRKEEYTRMLVVIIVGDGKIMNNFNFYYTLRTFPLLACVIS